MTKANNFNKHFRKQFYSYFREEKINDKEAYKIIDKILKDFRTYLEGRLNYQELMEKKIIKLNKENAELKELLGEKE